MRGLDLGRLFEEKAACRSRTMGSKDSVLRLEIKTVQIGQPIEAALLILLMGARRTLDPWANPLLSFAREKKVEYCPNAR